MGICANLRKFGLGYCDLPTLLWNVTVMLRPLLLDIDSRHKKGIHVIFYVVFVIIVACFIYVFVFSGFWFVFVRSLEPDMAPYRQVGISLLISTEMGSVKLFFLFLNRAETKRLIDGYLACDALVDPNSRLARNLLKALRIVKKRATIYWLLVIGNGFIYCIKPIFFPTVRTPIDKKYIMYGLEPMLESPNYELNTILMTAAIIFTVYAPANISVLIVFMVGYSEAQLLGLSVELKSMWEDAEAHCEDMRRSIAGPADVDDTDIKNKFVREKLKNIKMFHEKNIKLMKETEYIFRNALAGQLLMLMLSLITDLLGGLKNTYIQIPFASVQVALDCLAGQKLLDAGAAFERALYNSKWENLDIANRRTIVLMLLNSQRTLSLSAGGISVLNFELLMRIIRAVYSAYTALQSKT